MILSRALRPLLSSLPYQAATFFPEKKNPPYWLENLGKPGKEKKFPRLYPWIHKVQPQKLLPCDDEQPYPVTIKSFDHVDRKRQKRSRAKEKKREKVNIITENEVKIVVVSNNIMGRWKKLHPIIKQINKKPLDHAILQCYFNSNWSPRYRDTLTTLLNARGIAKEGGIEDTSDLWIDYATCARYQTDKNGLTVHAKGMQGSLVRYWSNLSVTVVKGPPNKKKDFKGEVHHEHYAKYLPPLEIQESKTFR